MAGAKESLLRVKSEPRCIDGRNEEEEKGDEVKEKKKKREEKVGRIAKLVCGRR